MDELTLTQPEPNSWFVIWTESRAEKKVEARIGALGLATWLPTVKERHRWSDRWREVVCPLFPGYLFARMTPSVEWHRVLRTPGVLTVVKRESRPALLSDSFVSGLQRAISHPEAAVERVDESTDYLPGDEVIVQEGPLKGVRGAVRERRSGRQLVIWVADIGRGVAFTIGSALVKSVAPRGAWVHPSSADLTPESI